MGTKISEDIKRGFAEIGGIIRRGKRFLVVSHMRPDGDAIGSAIALGRSLELAGKDVVVLNEHSVPANLRFMAGMEMLEVAGEKLAEADAVFILDTADEKRIGEGAAAAISATGYRVGIDHHVTNSRYADLNVVDVESPATGQIIYELIRELELPFDPVIRDALFVAISTDTGSFQYRNTTGDTMRIVGELLDEGADVAAISQALYATRPLRKVRLMGELLHGMEITAGGKYASWGLSREIAERIGVVPGDKEGLVEELRAVEGVVVAVLFDEQKDGEIRVSMRSKDGGVDVSEICAKFGGGGHRLAAGASLEGPLSAAKKLISNSVIHALNGKHA